MFKHFYLKTGQCKYGAPCKFNHPKDIQIPSATQENKSGETETAIKTEGFEVAVKPLVSFSAALLYYSKELPVRPGEADCPFYLKTGRWERALLFVLSALDRLSVKFHHPIDRPAVALSTTKPSQQENVKLTLAGLPRREVRMGSHSLSGLSQVFLSAGFTCPCFKQGCRYLCVLP
ncbi:zinc finger CCCH domain-containing protein 37 isoform X3 [Rosa chinensis]|uniref:zinc finger CCCH domain-containing protein 37 isoform X3 n=1 Tax=Rosa chinensis TaxID=74649 RepID=UPI001AD8FEF5|nr:zinc finger CCCH domain-containing protein 37 isoform X3 [Rosa chinensis]